MGGPLKRISASSTIFATRWFEVVAKKLDQEEEPYYSLRMPDYVTVLPVTAEHEVILVRQYRPALDSDSLELPAGHVEADESPEEAAARELLEETNYQTDAIELLGYLHPDAGRLANLQWCFFAPNARLANSARKQEAGIEVVVCPVPDFWGLISSSRLRHALDLAAVSLAILKKKLPPIGT